MPLVFVHGVATRPKPEYLAEVAQRDALFRELVLHKTATVLNTDWGSNAVVFTDSLPWLPKPDGNQAYSAAADVDLDALPGGEVGLAALARKDLDEAVDLAVAGALEQAILEAAKAQAPGLAAGDSVKLAALASAALDAPDGSARAKLTAAGGGSDAAFADALGAVSVEPGHQAFGGGDFFRRGLARVWGWVGNQVSDAALKLKRRDLSRGAAYFLGDVFIYLRQHDVQGDPGVRARLFEPILKDLINAWKAPRGEKEPFIVVCHSLGGVITYDLLTDPICLARLEAEAPGFKIDVWTTVGSQPGFFADLQLYNDKPKGPSDRLAAPGPVGVWHNVFDYTDIFSFLCEPAFEGVEDFGYDSEIDLVAAHTTYFKRLSFYKRMRLRLQEMGYA